jgi:hypothetical protein
MPRDATLSTMTPYARLVTAKRDWLAKNEPLMCAKARETLSTWFRTRHGHFPAASTMQYAAWLATSGAVKVLDGDRDGWKLIHDAWCLDASLVTRDLRRGVAVGVAAPEILLPLAGLLVCGDLPRLRSARGIAAGTRTKGDDHGWGWTALADLLFFLVLRVDGLSLPLLTAYEEPSSVCLRAMVDAWNDDAALAAAARNAAEYHLVRARSPRVGAEFVLGAYPIIGIEFAAVRAVRQREQRGPLAVEHELASSPLAFPPAAPLLDISDDLVRQTVSWLDGS